LATQGGVMMSFKGHEGFGQVAVGGQASHGAGLPWWAGPQLLYGEPAPLSPPEETRREGQFQVVPGAQGTPDPAPPAAAKRGSPEVLKFSVFQGERSLSFYLCVCVRVLVTFFD
jgi:nuclear transcription factor Y alpha